MFGSTGYRDCHGDYVDEMDMEDHGLLMYSNQSSLKTLPVPDLHETCEKYLKTVRPLVDDEAYEKTVAAVKEFTAPGGMGEELQRRLLARRAEKGRSSWLAHWWNTWGYLQVRDPVVVNVSYFFHLADGPLPAHRNQAVRAASLLVPLLKFHEMTISGALPANTARGTPLDMTAYKYIFNACRIPQREQDCWRLSDPAANMHVVVARHHKFYRLELLTPLGRPLAEAELARRLQDVIDCAGTFESPLGALTSWDRDSWADARAQLLEDGNEAALRAIEGAVCLVCLDAFPVRSREQMSKNLWHGDGRNRWYDKSIQLVVAENGAAGLLMEHSMADGFPFESDLVSERVSAVITQNPLFDEVLRTFQEATTYADYMLKHERAEATSGKVPQIPLLGAGACTAGPGAPQKIDFRVSKATLANIAAAERAFDALVASHDVRVLAFQGFGSSFLKTLKVSPDAFCQMAIQLAYYQMTGTVKPTYEAAMMLPFRHGRTETVRSVSGESKAFVEAFQAAPEGGGGRAGRARLAGLLRAACGAQAAYTRAAAAGRGIDRHLLGLRFLRRPGEAAALFDDPSYAATSRWAISTSTLSNELFEGWGWGEVVPEGIGVAYSIKQASLQFNVAARADVDPELQKPQSMCHLLEGALLSMAALLRKEAESGGSGGLGTAPAPRAKL